MKTATLLQRLRRTSVRHARRLGFVPVLSATVVGQTPSVAPEAASATVAAVDLVRHIRVMTDDSMRGRDTPSHGLELTAHYVADQFQALGLQPGADRRSSWIQRYPVPGYLHLDRAGTSVVLMSSVRRSGNSVVNDAGETVGRLAVIRMDTDARPAMDLVRYVPRNFASIGNRPLMLLSGRHTETSIDSAAIDGDPVVYVPPVHLDSTRQAALIARISARSPGVLVLSNEDSVTFVRRLQVSRARPWRFADPYIARIADPERWATIVWPPVLAAFWTAVGVNVEQARADTVPRARRLPQVTDALFSLAIDSAPNGAPTAPNVVAVLEGVDPKLKDEYLVVVAHMDGAGEDTAATGAAGRSGRDNAAGVAALLELARAFKAGAPTRRSMVFLATSGGAKAESWGSAFFLDNHYHLGGTIVATIELDGRYRRMGTEVAIAGLRDVELAVGPDWMAARHPELGVAVTDGGSVAATPGTESFSFMRIGVPSLRIALPAVSDDEGGDTRDPLASPGAARTAQGTQFVALFVRELADAAPRPRWTPGGRERRLRALERTVPALNLPNGN